MASFVVEGILGWMVLPLRVIYSIMEMLFLKAIIERLLKKNWRSVEKPIEKIQNRSKHYSQKKKKKKKGERKKREIKIKFNHHLNARHDI